MVRFRRIRPWLCFAVAIFYLAGIAVDRAAVGQAVGQAVAQTVAGQNPATQSPGAAQSPATAQVTTPAEAQYTLAASYYEQDRWRQAAEEFHKFVEQFPADAHRADAMFYEGEALMQLDDFARAQAAFAELLKTNPPEAAVRRALFRQGEALFRLGDWAAAGERLTEFQSRFSDDPMIAYAVPYLADIAQHAGDHAKARELYSASLAAHADGALADNCRLGLARSLAAEGQVQQAERFFNLLAEGRGPLADDALFGKAEALRLAGDPAAASVFERLARDWPQSEWSDEGEFGQLQIALAAGDHDAVVALADRFAATFSASPLAPSAERMRGKSLLKQGDYAGAAETFAAITSGSAPREPLQVAGDAYYLAVAHLGQEQYEKARDAAGAVDLAGLPENVAGELLSARGAALAGMKEFPAAAADLERSLALHPDSPDADRRRAQLAVSLTSAGELDRAETVLNQMATSAKDRGLFAAAGRHFAETALAQRDNARAEKWFELLVDEPGPDAAPETTTTPDAAEAPAATDSVLVGGDGSTGAATDDPSTDGASETAPASGDAIADLSGLAWSQWKGGQYEAAESSFGRLVDEHPTHELAPEAALMRGKSLEKLDRASEALHAFQAVMENYPQSDECPEAMLSGAMLIAAGAHDEAAQDEAAAEGQADPKQAAARLLAQLVDRFPRFKRLDAALYERAWLLDELGETDDAAAVFAQLHAEHKSSDYWADATYRFAERAARAKAYDRAKPALAELLASNCDDEIKAHALFLESQVAASEERWAEVAGPLDRLLEAWPNHSLAPAAEYWIAESLFQSQSFEQAEARFAALAEKSATDPPTNTANNTATNPAIENESWLPMVSLRRAQMFARQKKWEEAYDVASRMPAQFPEFRQLYEVDYLIGRCLGKRGEFAGARKAYEQVILSPEGGRTETAAMAQWMIGESFFHQKSYDEAIKAYDQVVALFAWPKWQAGALLQAGKCYELLDNRADAEKYYARLLKDYPDSPFSAEAASLLKQKPNTKSAAGNKKQPSPARQASAGEP